MLKRLFITATIMFASLTTADALESVAIDDSVLNPALQGRLSLLEAKLNDAYALMAKIKNCNHKRKFYKEGASTDGECVSGSGGGGRRIFEFEEPPVCSSNENLSWSTNGWVCTLKNTPPIPPTCELGTEALRWDNGAWSCATITGGGDGSDGNDGQDGSDGSNGSNGSNNSNTNINNNNNTVIIGGSHTQPVPPTPTDPIGTCKIKKKVSWECTSTGAGKCLQTLTEVPECGCKAGYRRKTVTSTSIYKKYLCILD